MPRREVEELFAHLTAIFEDAAALAAEGQRRRKTATTARTLIDKISTAHAECGRLIDEIAGQLQQ
ncbi:hypothetical protein [Tabrizicola sp.]|uniref:hypothetical protein n=1 Tax=Tabrizicola sp. TaxID=2005166 RepID=UPI003F331561